MDYKNADLQGQLNIAVEAAHDAELLLLEGFEKAKTIDRKSSKVDWVTEYDRASEDLIVKRLIAANPDRGIVGEEGSRKEGSSGSIHGILIHFMQPIIMPTNFQSLQHQSGFI